MNTIVLGHKQVLHIRLIISIGLAVFSPMHSVVIETANVSRSEFVKFSRIKQRLHHGA